MGRTGSFLLSTCLGRRGMTALFEGFQVGEGALGAKKKGTRKRLQSKAGQHHSVAGANGLGEARCFAADCTLAASSCAKGREWERTPVGSENLQSSREGLSWVSPERPALPRMLGNGN